VDLTGALARVEELEDALKRELYLHRETSVRLKRAQMERDDLEFRLHMSEREKT